MEVADEIAIESIHFKGENSDRCSGRKASKARQLDMLGHELRQEAHVVGDFEGE